MLLPNRSTATSLIAATVFTVSPFVCAQEGELPEPDSAEFCVTAQQILANTEIESTNTIFDNMPDYRSSKPSVAPLNTYQVVTYSGATPIVVSCKVKAADHLRSEFGEEAAGKQRICPEISKLVLQQAIAQLETENLDAAEAAKKFVVDETEPYATGQSYLSEFEAVSRDAEGVVHIATPSLQTDWENWMFWILPDRFRGQTYCHIATVNYIKAVASGEMEPGAIIHTRDDAPTTPTGS